MMILDEIDFLADKDFRSLLKHIPTQKAWKSANVFDRRAKTNVINGNVRRAQKVHERSSANYKNWQTMCTRRLVGILRQRLPHIGGKKTAPFDRVLPVHRRPSTRVSPPFSTSVIPRRRTYGIAHIALEILVRSEEHARFVPGHSTLAGRANR